MAGRRSGKTWTGAHWVQRIAEESADAVIALVGRTAGDARKIMAFGPSGIMRIAPPWFCPRWYQTDQSLIWPNGAVAFLYSAEEPAKLRGPEHSHAWADEICYWADPETWDMLTMTMSGGDEPKMLVTTTPAISRILDDLLAEKTTAVTRASTYDNASNLPARYLKNLLKRYEGTQLGRQELMGELLADIEGARFKREMIERARVATRPALSRVVVAVDPAGMTYSARTGGTDRALAGIVVAGLGEADEHCYVLADLSQSATPGEWGRIAIKALQEFRADRIVYETNHGGKAVEEVFRSLDENVPLKGVNARQGKLARAEPVVALYEQQRVHHVGPRERAASASPEQRTLAHLEDQMCGWTPKQRRSPDRMDALVYAVTELVLDASGFSF